MYIYIWKKKDNQSQVPYSPTVFGFIASVFSYLCVIYFVIFIPTFVSCLKHFREWPGIEIQKMGKLWQGMIWYITKRYHREPEGKDHPPLWWGDIWEKFDLVSHFSRENLY